MTATEFRQLLWFRKLPNISFCAPEPSFHSAGPPSISFLPPRRVHSFRMRESITAASSPHTYAVFQKQAVKSGVLKTSHQGDRSYNIKSCWSDELSFTECLNRGSLSEKQARRLHDKGNTQGESHLNVLLFLII